MSNITSLMPLNSFGQTTASHPTIWFHIPYKTEAFHSVAFVLRDSQRNNLYRTRFSSEAVAMASSGMESGLPGIIGLSVPPTVEPLAIAQTAADQVYSWQLVVYCKNPAIDPSASVFVSGTIQRRAVTEELQQQLNQANHPLEKASVTAEAGLWFDTIEHLHNASCHESSAEIQAIWVDAWTSLLTDPDVKLPDLATILPQGCTASSNS